jgi:hypothetical protein
MASLAAKGDARIESSMNTATTSGPSDSTSALIGLLSAADKGDLVVGEDEPKRLHHASDAGNSSLSTSEVDADLSRLLPIQDPGFKDLNSEEPVKAEADNALSTEVGKFMIQFLSHS